MRQRTTLLILLASLAAVGVAWLAFRRAKPPASPASVGVTQVTRDVPPPTSGALPPRVVRAPIEAGNGALRISGTVLDIDGAVPGAQIIATLDDDGDAIARRACPCEGETDQRLVDCDCDDVPEQLVTLVSKRSGEVVPVAGTTTNADGTFTLEGLQPGKVTLWAEAGDRGVGTLHGVAAGSSGVKLVLETGRNLYGTVVSEDDVPLAGVALTAVHKQESRYFDGISTAGAFRIGPVPAGDYRLVAWDGRHLPEAVDMPDGNDATRIVLRDPRTLRGRVLRDGQPVAGAAITVSDVRRTVHETTGMDGLFAIAGLRPGDYDVTARSGSQIGGTSVDLTGRDAPSVDIVLGTICIVTGFVRDDTGAAVDGAKIRSIGVGVGGDTNTGADGSYRLELAAGAWTVTAAADGYLNDGARRSLRLNGGAAVQADFVLPRASTITGVVVDPSGAIVAGATLDAVAAGQEQGESVARAASDKDGEFRLDLPAGAFQITAKHPQYRATTVSARAPSTGLRLVLSAGGTISGRVLDGDGGPVIGAAVRATSGAGDAGAARSDRTAVTGATGHFLLEGLEEGLHTVRATQRSETSIASVSGTVVVRLRETAEITLQFEKGADIAGIVIDAARQPVADVTVNAIPDPSGKRAGADWDPEAYAPERRSATTGADGRFVLANAHGASWRLWVESDYHRQEAAVHAAPGAKDVQITLQSRATVRGRVLDGAGQPIPFFTVDTDEVTAADGVFRHVVDRNFRSPLMVAAPGYAVVQREVVVRPGAEVDLGDITLGAGRVVTGSVVDAVTGAPLEGARIVLDEGYGADNLAYFAGDLDGGATTSETGRFRMENVPVEDAVVAVVHPDYGVRIATLGAGQATVTLRITRGPSIAGRVMREDGSGAYASVTATSPEGRRVTTRTDEDGAFRLAGLVRGVWRVSAMTSDDRAIRPVSVEVPSEGEVRVDLRAFTGGATLRVKVLDSGGAVAAAAYAFLVPGVVAVTALSAMQETEGLRTPETGSGKVLTFRGLEAGHYTLIAIRMSVDADPGEPKLDGMATGVDVPDTGALSMEVRLEPSKLVPIPYPHGGGDEIP